MCFRLIPVKHNVLLLNTRSPRRWFRRRVTNADSVCGWAAAQAQKSQEQMAEALKEKTFAVSSEALVASKLADAERGTVRKQLRPK
eukprot:1178566-Prorocentrum_minimum.AAC.5